MSRRDTIIVAVLVNAGLLIVLFASALKTHSSREEMAVAAPNPVMIENPESSFKKETTAVIGDEVDQALKQFSQTTAAVSQVPINPPIEPLPAIPNFADDLKAISLPETSAASVAQNLTTPLIPAEQSHSDYIEIKVKKGDVLEKIARHHRTTVAEIMKVNKLTSSNLRIGQVLKIPNKTLKKAESFPIANTSSGSSTPVYYTVKKGDVPWTIAVKHHMKVEDLLKLNNLSEEQARRLKPGDQLRITP